MVLAEPGDAVGAAGLLINEADDQKVSVGWTPAAICQLNPCRYLGSRLRLHVERAAAPKLSINHFSAPRVVRPLVGVGEHRVAVREQAERWPVGGAAQPRYEVRPLWRAADERHFEARRLEVGCQFFLQRALIPWGIDRVVGNQTAEQARRVVGQLIHSPILNEHG